MATDDRPTRTISGIKVTGNIPPSPFQETLAAIGPQLAAAFRPTSMDKINAQFAAMAPDIRKQLLGDFSIDQLDGLKGVLGGLSFETLMPMDGAQGLLPNLSATLGPNLQQMFASGTVFDRTFSEAWKLTNVEVLRAMPTDVAEQVDDEVAELSRTRIGDLSPDQQYLLLVFIVFVTAFGASLAAMAYPTRAKAVSEFAVVVFELLAQMNRIAPPEAQSE